MSIDIGKLAPDFSAPTDGDGTVSLSEFRGKIVVLYFYPKDSTSGCTTEACDFRDNMERITSANAVVLGVSPDSVKSHNTFKKNQSLNFMLVSDETKEICQQYGVWKEKSMYGRKYMGVERSTFLIDADGNIAKEWRKVSVTGHVNEVISAIEQLS